MRPFFFRGMTSVYIAPSACRNGWKRWTFLGKRPRTTVPPHHPKKYEKTGEESRSRGFDSVWMCVCPFFFGVEAVEAVFRFISMARLAADFADLLHLEVGWKLVHRRHCGSTYGLSLWQGKALATLEMKMTVTCCAEILLLTPRLDELGKLKRNLAISNPRCNMHSPHPLVFSCFCCLPGGWEPWDPHAHGNLTRPDGRRRRVCKVNWRNLNESCWSWNAKHRFFRRMSSNIIWSPGLHDTGRYLDHYWPNGSRDVIMCLIFWLRTQDL